MARHRPARPRTPRHGLRHAAAVRAAQRRLHPQRVDQRAAPDRRPADPAAQMRGPGRVGGDRALVGQLHRQDQRGGRAALRHRSHQHGRPSQPGLPTAIGTADREPQQPFLVQPGQVVVRKGGRSVERCRHLRELDTQRAPFGAVRRMVSPECQAIHDPGLRLVLIEQSNRCAARKRLRLIATQAQAGLSAFLGQRQPNRVGRPTSVSGRYEVRSNVSGMVLMFEAGEDEVK